MNKNILKINENDNLIVALKTLEKGTEITIGEEKVILQEEIPAKHKFTLIDLPTGSTGTLYGVTVGKTTEDVTKGKLIRTSNFVHASDSYSKI